MKKRYSYLIAVVSIFIIAFGIFTAVLSTNYCFNCKPKMGLQIKWNNYKGSVKSRATRILSLLNDTLNINEEQKIITVFKKEKNINLLVKELDTVIHHNKSTLTWLVLKFGETNMLNKTSVISFIKNRGKPSLHKDTRNIRIIDSLIFFGKKTTYQTAKKYMLLSGTNSIFDNSTRLKAASFLCLRAKGDTLKLNPSVNKLFKEIAKETPLITGGNVDNKIFNNLKHIYKF